MYGEAVQMAEIHRRKLGPGREQKRRKSCGNADRVQKIIQKLRRLYCVDCNNKDVDTAKMKRKIVYGVPTANRQADHLEKLV